MRVSVCVGNYASTPYCITSLGIRVYCMEELCYCLRENAFLLDLSLLAEELVDWIDTECGLKELAKELYPMVRKQGSLSAFVTMILEYVQIYEGDVIRSVERVLKEGSGLSGIEKRKKQVDYLVQKGQYPAAVRRYDDLIAGWQQNCNWNQELHMGKVKADIYHNKGVALVGMMEYAAAAECFQAANELYPDEEHYQAYLAAKRMELDESEYLALIAAQPESYQQTLRLEKEIEKLEKSFPEQESGRWLAEMEGWRYGNDKQKYYDEVDRITQTMKDNYRIGVRKKQEWR